MSINYRREKPIEKDTLKLPMLAEPEVKNAMTLKDYHWNTLNKFEPKPKLLFKSKKSSQTGPKNNKSPFRKN